MCHSVQGGIVPDQVQTPPPGPGTLLKNKYPPKNKYPSPKNKYPPRISTPPKNKYIPPRYSQRVGGTHPTGMQTCLFSHSGTVPKALDTPSGCVCVSIDTRSRLEIGYDTDTWCGLYRCKSMWTITSLNTYARYG